MAVGRSGGGAADRLGPEAFGDGSRELFRLENVVAGYADCTVLRGVDLVVRPGEAVALLGANGAGKSTACAVAAGDLPATAGRVLLDGADITAWPAYRRARAGVLLAPEGRGVFPGLTVEENLRTWLPDPAQVYERLPRLAERRAVPAGRCRAASSNCSPSPRRWSGRHGC